SQLVVKNAKPALTIVDRACKAGPMHREDVGVTIFKATAGQASARQASMAAPTDSIAAEQARWERETFAPDAERVIRNRAHVADCGIEVRPLYKPADLAAVGFDYLDDLGFPGEYPFTRGDRGAMNRGEPFVVSAYSGFGDARVCNQRFRT